MNLTKTNKTNKIKLVARVMLVILLLTSTLSFVSCSEPNCKKGQYYNIDYGAHELSLSLKAISDSIAFPINDVTFKLCIGLNNRRTLFNWFKIEKYTTPQIPYYSEDWYYVVCAIHETNWNQSRKNDESVLNYAYILKEIPHIDAFSSNQYYFIHLWQGEYFNYCENITIPSNFFVEDVVPEDRGIYIGIFKVEKSSETGEYISDVYSDNYLYFSYAVQNDKVTLYFPHQN